MKWPRNVRYRHKVLAKVYRPSKARPSYRVVWRAARRRMMKSFPTYAGKGGAKEYAEALVKDLWKNAEAIMLTPAQATDALAALERLATFHQATGRKVSLLAATSEYCDAAGALRGHALNEAVTGFLRTAATVKHVELAAAIEEFIASQDHLTRAPKQGDRPQLSPKYHYNRSIQLRRFAETFPGFTVADLGKESLDAFFTCKLLAGFSAKARNHHRQAVRQFLGWCVRKDYLPPMHRLLESDGLRPEHANTSAVEYYEPKEFRALLDAADDALRPLLAIGGLAGLRTQELLRLTWEDVWRKRGLIDVTREKSKTRNMRSVEMCAALAAWLQPCRSATGLLWTGTEAQFQNAVNAACETAGISRKKNGLRHSFCTFSYLLRGEDWTARQSGNTPEMVHGHYRGVAATKAEATRWFNIRPAGEPANVIPLPQKGAAA